MKKFDVFINEKNEVKLVKDGFSWPGFFFTGWWFLYKCRFWNFVIVSILEVIMSLYFRQKWVDIRDFFYYFNYNFVNDNIFNYNFFNAFFMSVFPVLFINLCMKAFIGAYGNDSIACNLIYKGYFKVESFNAENMEQAREQLGKYNLNLYKTIKF